jgi:hypothetical protein
MRERYGLDTSTFSYDPEVAPQQEAQQGLGQQRAPQDGPPVLARSKHSRCVVM